MQIEQLLTYTNLIVVGVIVVVIEATKKVGKPLKFADNKAFRAILPLLPLILGAVAGFIPGAIQFAPAPEGQAMPELTTGLRVMIGVFLGGMSGQLWKVIKTKLDLVTGKL